jgi:hypothetical protein
MSPNIARSEMALWKLYLVDSHCGSRGDDGHHRWEIREGRGAVRVRRHAEPARPRLPPPHRRPVGLPPELGRHVLDALSRFDRLQTIRLTALGCYALDLTDTYHPPTGDEKHRRSRSYRTSTSSPPEPCPPGDQLLLSAYAEHTADRVWTITAASLLSAIDTGRNPEDLTTFLSQQTTHEQPYSLRTVIDDVTPPSHPADRPRRRSGDRMPMMHWPRSSHLDPKGTPHLVAMRVARHRSRTRRRSGLLHDPLAHAEPAPRDEMPVASHTLAR